MPLYLYTSLIPTKSFFNIGIIDKEIATIISISSIFILNNTNGLHKFFIVLAIVVLVLVIEYINVMLHTIKNFIAIQIASLILLIITLIKNGTN